MLQVSGRSFQDDLDSVAGPMFNTIPLAVDISRLATHKELVNILQKYSSALSAFQHVPLRLIRKWIKAPTNCSLFDCIFVFQGEQISEFVDAIWADEEIEDYTTEVSLRSFFVLLDLRRLTFDILVSNII